MKRTKIITTLAITTLVFSACGNSEGTATEPEVIQEQEVQETPTDQYQITLDDLGIPLDEDRRLEIAYQACMYMLTDAMGTREFLDEIEYENIRLGNTYVIMELTKEDVEEPHGNEVTRAAIEYVCPEVKDQMTDDAWTHSVFREDQRERLQESN